MSIQQRTSLSEFVVALLLFVGTAAQAATNSVTSLANSGAGSLPAVISASAAGDTITFAVNGTITLTAELGVNKDLVIVGPGASLLAISGNNGVRVFSVSSNVSLTLSGLSIVDGLATVGGGIRNSGTLVLRECTLRRNAAVGPAASSYSGHPGTNGYGGAVHNSGFLNAINCTFCSNSVTGGAGAMGGMPSSSGGAGANGNGGAIANSGSLLITGCLFANNSATGGVGGDGLAAFYGCPGGLGGAGGNGGFGNGGALYNDGLAHFVNNTFALNAGAGGRGGAGGSGGPPSSESCSTGNGGHGGVGGSGNSAVFDASGQCYFTNCTVASNTATAGAGGPGGPAGPWPYPSPPRTGSPGGNGANGTAGSALDARNTHLLNTLLSGNAPLNCIGSIADDGHNLSSDASCILTNVGSMTNADPMLGPLADNGGATLTMAVGPTSLAIDAGVSPGSPATDQRGVLRPQGLHPDIGAYEYQFPAPQITAARLLSPSQFWLRGFGLPNQVYAVQVSANLSEWSDLIGIVTGSNGMGEVVDLSISTNNMRFYRLKWIAPLR